MSSRVIHAKTIVNVQDAKISLPLKKRAALEDLSNVSKGTNNTSVANGKYQGKQPLNSKSNKIEVMNDKQKPITAATRRTALSSKVQDPSTNNHSNNNTKQSTRLKQSSRFQVHTSNSSDTHSDSSNSNNNNTLHETEKSSQKSISIRTDTTRTIADPVIGQKPSTNVINLKRRATDDDSLMEESSSTTTQQHPKRPISISYINENALLPEHQANINNNLHAPKRQKTIQPWDDLDAGDFDDPTMVSEYAPEIFQYLYELELKYMPDHTYMSIQPELEWSTREVLMDWIIDTHAKLRLLPETLFLACNIIDRFMSVRSVTVNKIQLVGITSLLIAAKYEEVFPPAAKYFSYLTSGNFDEEDILDAERFILQVLEYELSYPNPLNYLRRISKADDYDVRTRSFGKYLLEVGIMEHRLLKFPPSHVAAAAMYLSRRVVGKEEWDANLEHYSGDLPESSLMEIVQIMLQYLVQNTVTHDALFKKYASKRYFKASIAFRQWAKDHISHFVNEKSNDSHE